MNFQTRIDTMAKQCYSSDHLNFDYTRFAKMIAEECIQILIDNTPERFTNEAAEEDWDKGYDRAMTDCVHHIQEHFGVE